MDFMLIQSYLEKLPSLEELHILPEIKDLIKKFGKSLVDERLKKILDDRHFAISTAKTETSVKRMDFSMNFYINLISEQLLDEKEHNVKKVINCLGTVYSDYIGSKIYSKELLKDFSDSFSFYNNIRYDLSNGKELSLEDEIIKLLKTYYSKGEYLIFSNFSGAFFTLINSYYKDFKIISSVKESYTFENSLDLNGILEIFNLNKKTVGSLNKIDISHYEKEISEKSLVLLSDFYGNSLDGLAKLKEDEIQKLLEKEKTLFISDKFYLNSKNSEITSNSLEFKKYLNFGKVILADFSKNEDLPKCIIMSGAKEVIELIKNSIYYKMFYPSKEIETLLYFGLVKKITEKKENSYMESILQLDETKLKKRNIKFVEELQKSLGTSSEIGLLEGPYLKIEEGVSYREAFNRELIVVTPKKRTAEEIEVKLRNSDVPVLCWINDGSLLINLQLVDKRDEKNLLEILAGAIKK